MGGKGEDKRQRQTTNEWPSSSSSSSSSSSFSVSLPLISLSVSLFLSAATLSALRGPQREFSGNRKTRDKGGKEEGKAKEMAWRKKRANSPWDLLARTRTDAYRSEQIEEPCEEQELRIAVIVERRGYLLYRLLGTLYYRDRTSNNWIPELPARPMLAQV